MTSTDTNHVDLAEARDRHRAYARAIANLMRANEPQSTLTQAGRDELYATVLEAACESAKDVPGLADQVQQLRDDLAANESNEDARLAIAEEQVRRLREGLDAIGNLAYRCDPASPFVGDCLAQIHTRAKNAAKE